MRLERAHGSLTPAFPLLCIFQHVLPNHTRLAWFVTESSSQPENLTLTDRDLQSTFDGVVVEVSGAVGSSEHQECTAEAPICSLLPFLSVREPGAPQGKQAVPGARLGAEHSRRQRTPHTGLWKTQEGGMIFH